MVSEIKTFEFKCDKVGCETKAIVQAKRESEAFDKLFIHAGWSEIEVSGCGLTGYTSIDQICPKCKESVL